MPKISILFNINKFWGTIALWVINNKTIFFLWLGKINYPWIENLSVKNKEMVQKLLEEMKPVHLDNI